jgi:hypothetical protein
MHSATEGQGHGCANRLLPFSLVALLARCWCHEVLSSLGLLRGDNSAPALTSPVSSNKQVITIYIYLLVYL